MAGNAPSPTEDSAKMLQAYTKYLPGLMQVTSSAQPGVDLNSLKSAQQTSPGYAQLALDQYQKFGLPTAEVGQKIQNSNVMSSAQTNADVIAGPGSDAARAAQGLNKELNPAYYSTLQKTGDKANDLLGAVNLNGLSGGEQSAVERSLNQSNTASGNLGLSNPTNIISNAMNFGGAFNDKLGRASNAIGTATNFLNTASPGAVVNPAALASGLGSSGTNSATSAFNPVQQAGNQSYGMGQSLLGDQASMYNSYVNPRWQATNAGSPMGLTSSSASALGSVAGAAGSCCFIFLEAQNGQMPWWVRECRDEYYSLYPRVAAGYKRMAKLLVPLMKKSKAVKNLVNRWMVIPITNYGGYLKKVEGYENCRKNEVYKNFWFSIWNILGA